MEMNIGSIRTAEDMNQNISVNAPEQQKEASEGAAERKGMDTQQDAGEQQTSYDAVSLHGDTLSISKEGKNATYGTDHMPINEDTSDGIVIRKKEEENSQEDDASTINLSTYTETELRQMYLDGDITRAEYDEEINSRETQEAVPEVIK